MQWATDNLGSLFHILNVNDETEKKKENIQICRNLFFKFEPQLF